MVKKNDYNTKMTEIVKKISWLTGLVTIAALNTKAKTKNKTPDITNLAIKAALNKKSCYLKLNT